MKLYPVIVIDPPWEYDNPRAIVGNGGRGSKGASRIIQTDVTTHYSTMSIERLKKLKLPASKNCLLFMWVTNIFLANGEGSDLVRSWGFNPKTVLTWSKVKIDGITPSMKSGHWFRGASEHVIFGMKGRVHRPDDYPALPTWFPNGRLPHSVKPDQIHEYAEAAYPDGPYLEIFARTKRKGWDVIGNEIGKRIIL